MTKREKNSGEPRTRHALLAPTNRKERRRAKAIVSCLAKKAASAKRKARR